MWSSVRFLVFAFFCARKARAGEHFHFSAQKKFFFNFFCAGAGKTSKVYQEVFSLKTASQKLEKVLFEAYFVMKNDEKPTMKLLFCADTSRTFLRKSKICLRCAQTNIFFFCAKLFFFQIFLRAQEKRAKTEHCSITIVAKRGRKQAYTINKQNSVTMLNLWLMSWLFGVSDKNCESKNPFIFLLFLP